MSETEVKDNKTEVLAGETFFLTGTPIVEKEKKTDKTSSVTTDGSSFIGKGSNKTMTEPYNMHFTISGQMFLNIITFINQIDYKAVLQFKQKEMNIMLVDGGNTHVSLVKFDKLEFSDYKVDGLLNDDDEKMILIDISIIIDKLNVDDTHPIDFYVDTLVNNRFYAICGKQMIYRQLNSMNVTGDVNAVSTKYNSLKDMVKRVIINPDYQRIVVAQTSLSNLIKSLVKNKSEKKDEIVGCLIKLFKNKLIFIIKDEVAGNEIDLSGEDILVYPTHDDTSGFNVEYFIKFGKLKTSYTTTMYMHEGLPIVFESRLGGGSIVLYYLIAPRAV